MITNSIEAPLRLFGMLRLALPWFGISREVAIWRLKNFPNFWRGFWRIGLARLFGLPHMYGRVFLKVTRGNGETVDLGLASLRVITDGACDLLVAVWRNLDELEDMKYHGFGVGTIAETNTQSSLNSELDSGFYEFSQRPSGTPGVGVSTEIVRTVATFNIQGGAAITEHGIFDDNIPQSGAIMWDRSKFAAVNLTTPDSLQVTYECTFVSGG